MQEKIIILDFGSQTTQLIARRVRELNTYCEIVPYNKFPHNDPSIIGVILSGSPFSVYDESAFKVDLSDIRGKYPILGICYGAQFMSYTNGGKVEPAGTREYGRAHLSTFDQENPLLKNVREHSQVWMSHGDTITAIPENFKIIASTDKVAIAAYQIKEEKVWGVQFHPEVFHSEDGTQLLKNFVVDICGGKQDWSAASFIETTVAELKAQLGNDKVVLGLSGGVDSSVAAVLLNKAIGKNLTCIFVDHGMLRKNEFKNVLHDYECLGLNVIGVDASQKFFSELAGVEEPEKKRKIIGKGFIDVFDEEAHKITDVKSPLSSCRQPDSFKLYMNDEGILYSMLHLSQKEFMANEKVRQILYENHIAKTLAEANYALYYYQSEGKAEVDFVIQNRMGKIIPIELATISNSKAKSLSVFMKKYTVLEAYRITENNFSTKKEVRYLPVYAVFCLNDLKI